mgnify:CR=1 FL=1
MDLLQNAIKTNDHQIVLASSSYSGIGGDKTKASRGDEDFWLVKLSLPSVPVGLTTMQKKYPCFFILILPNIQYIFTQQMFFLKQVKCMYTI